MHRGGWDLGWASPVSICSSSTPVSPLALLETEHVMILLQEWHQSLWTLPPRSKIFLPPFIILVRPLTHSTDCWGYLFRGAITGVIVRACREVNQFCNHSSPYFHTSFNFLYYIRTVCEHYFHCTLVTSRYKRINNLNSSLTLDRFVRFDKQGGAMPCHAHHYVLGALQPQCSGLVASIRSARTLLTWWIHTQSPQHQACLLLSLYEASHQGDN